jgi:hypothetical protein
MLVIVNLIVNFGIQRNGDLLIMNGHITNKMALDMIKDITAHVGNFLLLIEKVPIDSLFEDLTIDFKVHRLTLLNSITDLMKMARNLSINHDKETCSEMLITIQLVEKACKDVLISVKFLWEEKENMERETLQEYINNQASPSPSSATAGLRHAASMSFKAKQMEFHADAVYSIGKRDNIRNSNQSPEPDVYSATQDTRLMNSFRKSNDTPNSSPYRNERQSNVTSEDRSSVGWYSKYQKLSILDDIDLPTYPSYLGYDTPPEDLKVTVEGYIKGGTLNALVERLTDHRTIDEEFVSTFMLTYRSFTNSKILIDLIISRFSLQPPFAAEKHEWTEKKLRPVRLRVYTVLKVGSIAILKMMKWMVSF